MVKFKNKSTELVMAGENDQDLKQMTYGDLVVICMNTPPANGAWTTSEMRSRIKIEEKVEEAKADEIIEFEEAEIKKIVECSKQPWRFKHKVILEFEEYLLTL